MAADKPTINAKEFLAALQKEGKPEPLGEDQLLESAIGALNTIKGLTRGDKIKVIKRMRKILDA